MVSEVVVITLFLHNFWSWNFQLEQNHLRERRSWQNHLNFLLLTANFRNISARVWKFFKSQIIKRRYMWMIFYFIRDTYSKNFNENLNSLSFQVDDIFPLERLQKWISKRRSLWGTFWRWFQSSGRSIGKVWLSIFPKILKNLC